MNKNVSTVDDLESFDGDAAVVLALEDVPAVHGHYGVGDGATSCSRRRHEVVAHRVASVATVTDVPVDAVPESSAAPDASVMVQSLFARATAAMTVLTAVSRLTGFVRIVVVAAVLGTTFLGNTYESANTVPNLLFELIAAGVLQAVLIPTLVSLLDRGDRTEAEHVAGSVLGLSCLILAALGRRRHRRRAAGGAGPLRRRSRSARPRRRDSTRHGVPLVLPAAGRDVCGRHGGDRHPQRPQPVRPSGVRPGPEQRRRHRVLRASSGCSGTGRALRCI